MRYLLLLLFTFTLSTCGAGPKSARGEDKPDVIARYEALVASTNETVGNQTAELEGVKEELSAVKQEVAAVKTKLNSLEALLTLESELPKAVEQAKASASQNAGNGAESLQKPAKQAPVNGITFHGKPINVAEWLSTPLEDEQVVEVEVNKRPADRAAVEKHVRWHGVSGDLSGFSREQLVQIHSVAHLKDEQKPRVVMNAAVVIPQTGGCLNGQCNRPQVWYPTARSGRRR